MRTIISCCPANLSANQYPQMIFFRFEFISRSILPHGQQRFALYVLHLQAINFGLDQPGSMHSIRYESHSDQFFKWDLWRHLAICKHFFISHHRLTLSRSLILLVVNCTVPAKYWKLKVRDRLNNHPAQSDNLRCPDSFGNLTVTSNISVRVPEVVIILLTYFLVSGVLLGRQYCQNYAFCERQMYITRFGNNRISGFPKWWFCRRVVGHPYSRVQVRQERGELEISRCRSRSCSTDVHRFTSAILHVRLALNRRSSRKLIPNL